MTRLFAFASLLLLLPACGSGSPTQSQSAPAQPIALLNVSYDPTRELWKEINAAFIPEFQATTGQSVTIRQSHGASGSQSRAIQDGLEADVATLSIWSDLEALHKKGFLRDGWETAFPNRSLPYTSTVIFVVRKGNPHQIRDWADLTEKEIQIITPSPKTSGNGKLSFLAAWGSVVSRGGSEDEARQFVSKLFARVPVLDTGSRGATTTFAQKGIGDVHLALENEAKLEVAESAGELELIYPSLSLIHEPHIAIVDRVVDRRGSRAAAEAYLSFLYTPAGQEIIARNHFRPSDPAVLEKHKADFPPLKLIPLTDIVAGWDEAQSRFFADGALFDQLYMAEPHK
jgi:sulfate/thiosulfate-binding protein